MAASVRVFACRFCSSRTSTVLLNDGFQMVIGVSQSCQRGIATSAVLLKKTPRTVGVPAWAKAAQRRRRSLVKLERPKTQEQIQAEYQLSNDPMKLDFYTTTRNARPKAITTSEDNLPDITVTKNSKAFVIYHPEKQDPRALFYSKDAAVRPWWYLSEEEIKDYRDNLTEQEIKEAQELRNDDPLLWTINSLSRLYKVKPLAIALATPLTEDQKLAVEVERKLLLQWTDYKRRDYRANQELERQKYIERTRGVEMNKALGLK